MPVVVIIRIQPGSGLLHLGCQAEGAYGSMRFNVEQLGGGKEQTVYLVWCDV